MTQRSSEAEWNSPLAENEQLAHAFASASSDFRDVKQLWTEIDFVDGTFTGPRQHHRQHDNDYLLAVNARHKLALLKVEELGLMEHFNFVPMALTKFDSALASIELGKTRKDLSISVPVVTDSKHAQLDVLLKRQHPIYNPNQSVHDNLQGYQISAFYTRNRASIRPIHLPPLWKGVYFRGIFKDGSPTNTYYTENQWLPPGFELECIFADGCLKTRAYAYITRVKKSDPSRSLLSHLKIPSPRNMTPEQLTELHRICLNVYSEAPAGAAWFDHFSDRELTNSRTEVMPGINYTLYLDRYGRKVGICTFRVDREEALHAYLMAIKPSREVQPPSVKSSSLTSAK